MSKDDPIIKKIKIALGNGISVMSSSTNVIKEINLIVHVNEKPLAHIACAGLHLKELAAGFLRSEKIISSRDEIKRIEIHQHKKSVNVILKNQQDFPKATVKNIASSGARGKTNMSVLTPLDVANDFNIKTGLILKLMDELLDGSVVHNQTGGTHCSALAIDKKMMALREDIGRHNTIDMLGGYALLENMDLSKAMILTTGRISSEIVYKIWNMGISMIISHSAPTANAVELSRKANILLIGYVRNDKFNIYSHERRVII